MARTIKLENKANKTNSLLLLSHTLCNDTVSKFKNYLDTDIRHWAGLAGLFEQCYEAGVMCSANKHELLKRDLALSKIGNYLLS